MTERDAWLKAAQEICEGDGRTRLDEAKRGSAFLESLDKDIELRAKKILRQQRGC
jgi:hypothetical protein